MRICCHITAVPKPNPIRPQLDALRAIYAEIEQRALPRQCEMRTTCCHFRVTGKTPVVTRIEALLAAQGVRASGKKKLTPHPQDACPMLGLNGRCTIYAHRPFGCRTHFCAEAGGPYPRQHVSDLIRRMEALDEAIGWHDGSRPFEAALEDALDEMR
jgi:Fe-S-cluster containining protein